MSNSIRKSFYSRNSAKLNQIPLKARLARREKEIRDHPFPKDYKDRISGAPSAWKVFFRQSDAFEYARAVSQNVHVFSYESEMFTEKKGQRLYLVTSYDMFWHYYRQLKKEKRNHYEVIPEGAVCKLYFDLEFSRTLNPLVDSNSLVETFIKYVSAELKKCFNITCDIHDIIILDASTPEKFSQHLIFILNDYAFHDNIHVGSFVKYICGNIHNVLNDENKQKDDNENKNADDHLDEPERKSRKLNNDVTEHLDEDQILKSASLSKEQLSSLKVKDKNNKDVLFCDTTVYTKNRNFRLYLSTKLNKNRPLVLAETNMYTPDPHENKTKEEQIFLDSIVHNVKFTENLKILSFDEQCSASCLNLTSTQGQRSRSSQEKDSTLSGYERSPYPEIDRFILSVINKGGVQGSIRRYVYFNEGEILIYDISKNRWCENIGRAHSSNNIMMVADIKNGVYYQKCHDIDCKGFKSQECPLPKSVLPASYCCDESDSHENVDIDDEIDDSSLLEAVREAERDEKEEWTDSQGEIDDQTLLDTAAAVEEQL